MSSQCVHWLQPTVSCSSGRHTPPTLPATTDTGGSTGKVPYKCKPRWRTFINTLTCPTTEGTGTVTPPLDPPLLKTIRWADLLTSGGPDEVSKSFLIAVHSTGHAAKRQALTNVYRTFVLRYQRSTRWLLSTEQLSIHITISCWLRHRTHHFPSEWWMVRNFFSGHRQQTAQEL